MNLLLFDLDGTLISTGGAGIRALDLAFKQLHGVDRAMEGISPAGNMDPLIVKEIYEKKVGRPATPQDVETACRQYLTNLPEELKKSRGYRMMPGIESLLEGLAKRADVVLALGTGNLEEGARIKLAPSNLNRFFPVGGFATDAHERPDMLRAAIRKAETHASHTFSMEKVFVIGDTILDVNAGKAVGAVTVAVECGHGKRQELLNSQPDIFLEDFLHPEPLLKQLI